MTKFHKIDDYSETDIKHNLNLKIYKETITNNNIQNALEKSKQKHQPLTHFTQIIQTFMKEMLGLIFSFQNIVVPPGAISFKINHMICEPFTDASKQATCCYKLYPRSSMGAKTPLRLCNLCRYYGCWISW